MTLNSPPVIVRPRRRPAGWGRARSARQVGRLLLIGQCWAERSEVVWVVRQIHRADRQAELVMLTDPAERQLIGFAKLGVEFRVLGEGQR